MQSFMEMSISTYFLGMLHVPRGGTGGCMLVFLPSQLQSGNRISVLLSWFDEQMISVLYR